MEFVIMPRFNEFKGSMYFETHRLNGLLDTEYNDKMGFYQSTFGVYSYMELNSDLEFVIHYPEGTPFMWQTHNNCAWTPTGTLQFNQMTIAPCKAKLNEQKCYDENFNSSYKAFMQWRTGGGAVEFSPVGQRATDMLVRALVKNASLGYRMTLVGGQLTDLSTVEFEDGVNIRIEDAFRKTANTCKGWIQLCKELGQQSATTHLNGDWIRAADISTDGKTWVGDAGRTVVDLYDEIMAAPETPTDLKNAVIEGGVGGFGNIYYPMFMLGLPEYHNIHAAWIAQKESATINEPRISRREYPYQTERGTRTMYVYFIDDTVVIPVSEPSQYDKYITGTHHFAYVTVSGVINLGGNFANLPVVNETEVSIIMKMSEDPEDYGTHKFLAHSLMATAINDTDYIAGDYVYAEPA